MRFSRFFGLLISFLRLYVVDSQTITKVWSSSFETDESDSWNVTSNNKPFYRVLYSSSKVPSQDGNWAIAAQGVNKELLLPLVAYYGGKITVSFYAYVSQSSVLIVQFLRENYEEIQSSDVSIKNSSWNLYSVPISNIQYPAFLVSFKYSSDIPIYMDSVKIEIDGNIISCSSITSANRCGFSTDVPSSNGWSFAATSVNWITSSAFTYLKRDFLYLGGLLKGSMNFRGSAIGSSVTIQISVNQTSYQQRINSGFTDFDLTASTQYTVGQTYTILITFVTTAIRAQLSSISMNVAGNCSTCNTVLTCSKFTNGVTCACKVNSCPGPNKQCIVSTIDPSINPCSCMSGYTEDSSGNCVGAATTTTNPPTTTAPQTTAAATTTSSTSAATTDSLTTATPETTTAPEKITTPKVTTAPEKITTPKVTTAPEKITTPKTTSAPEKTTAPKTTTIVTTTSSTDINECIGLKPPCSWSNGVCINTNGSYECTCASGWRMGQDNASCVDINECDSEPSLCSWKNGLCKNTNGSYLCICINGWKLRKGGGSCVDIDECDPCNQKSPCSLKVPCSQEIPCSWRSGVCVNTIGSYLCSCENGSILGIDGASCVEI